MSIPAGWYPDPSGAPGTRWWDGGQWTAHASPVAGYAAVPSAPAKIDVPTSTVWVWLAIAASVLPFFTIFLMDWPGFIDAIAATAATGADSSYLVTWQLNSLLISFVSWGHSPLHPLQLARLARVGQARNRPPVPLGLGLLRPAELRCRRVHDRARSRAGCAHGTGVMGAVVGLDRRDGRLLHRGVRVGLLVLGALFSALGPSMTYN